LTSSWQQSLSNLNTAKANLALAEITKNRYQGLIKTNAVAQQDVDNAVGTYNANQAIVEADRGQRQRAAGATVF
jgi:multidrug resistance efflux pump